MQPSSDLEEPILGMKAILPRLAKGKEGAVQGYSVPESLYKPTQECLLPDSLLHEIMTVWC